MRYRELAFGLPDGGRDPDLASACGVHRPNQAQVRARLRGRGSDNESSDSTYQFNQRQPEGSAPLTVCVKELHVWPFGPYIVVRSKSEPDHVSEQSLLIRTSERTTSKRHTSDHSYTKVLGYVERTLPPPRRLLRLLDLGWCRNYHKEIPLRSLLVVWVLAVLLTWGGP